MWKRVPKKVIHFSSRCLNTLPKDVHSQIPKAYSPAFVEEKWYEWWESNSFFRKEESSSLSSDRKFSMVLPPPNITGTLHLGHALTCAIQDSLICWNRMKGKDTVWFPGCDHAGIATQVIVEKNLKTRNITREQLGREKFLDEIWKWKDEKQNTINQQLKGLGATLNWEKAAFTMDPKMCYAVNEAFIRLHRKGRIYRKESLVNWSCKLRTAISDIEVDHRLIDEPTKLFIPGYDKPVAFGYIYQFEYQLSDSNERIMVSTTRPETIIGDTAIAVHPEDMRYGKYVGKFARHPIRNDLIPIIADSQIDQNFGTGAMKITPAHDFKDFEIAKRHGLQALSIFDNCGVANEHCGEFSGLARFELREKIIRFLDDNGFLHKILPHQMSVPVCSRSGDIVEPLLRPQWFVDTKEMGRKALEAVKRGHLKIHPSNFENVWFEWLGSIKDWCISRQLWWGHRIPAYSISGEKGAVTWIAAHNLQEATELAARLGISAACVEQDEDVLDTWFSSSLFPFSVCGWPENTADLRKFFPLDVMETGHDILFFWVARMVMMSLELTEQLPFKEVLLHGIICDSQGRKMSKSLGNVIDPLDIIYGASLQTLEKNLESSVDRGHLSPGEFKKAIDEKRNKFPEGIPQTGADALRFTLCSYNVKSHFINLDMAILKRNRLFCNKIWQATRFLFLQLDQISSRTHSDYDSLLKEPENSLLINQWIMSSLHATVNKVNGGMTRYDFHHATDALYGFLYGHLCDVFVEATKSLNEVDQQECALTLAVCLDTALRCLAPFMPFLSEELYQRLHSKLDSNKIKLQRSTSVLTANYPENDEFAVWRNVNLDKSFDLVLRAAAELRSMKLEYSLMKSKPDAIFICPSKMILDQADQFSKFISTTTGLKSITICSDMKMVNSSGDDLISRTVDDCSVHLNVTGLIDRRVELKKSRDKLKKLIDNLARLEANMNASSYRMSAPPQVQEAHRVKAAALRTEISQLEAYAKMLET